MKTILIVSVLALGLLACTDGSQKNNTKMEVAAETVSTGSVTDQSEIISLMKTLFNETDNRNWEAVKQTMADTVYVDYTALGGDAGFKTPDEIVSGWQSLLPGFDRTVHQPHNFSVWVAGERASATLDAIATHYIHGTNHGNQWTVFVGYDTEYVKDNGVWKLARIDVSVYDQSGNTGLPLKAIEIVKNGGIKPLSVDTEVSEAVDRFFRALEDRDLENVLSTMDEGVIQHMPFAPSNFPNQLTGIDEMRKQYTGVMDYQQSYDREYFTTADQGTVLVKYSGTITTGEGKPYNNSYVGIFQVKNEKIIDFKEFFNPNILLDGWPGLQPETYSVHATGARTNSGVTVEDVVFNSNGANLKGHLFLPTDFAMGAQYPAVIVTGSWTSVKEQMPDEYASLIAQEGFMALTFDFTGFGESEGQPRQVEDYDLKIADIKAAVDFLSTHPAVNKSKLSGLGVCASSGYMAHATAQDERIQNLVLVAPWLHNAEIARGIYDFRPGGTDGLLASARRAKQDYAETGKMEYVLAASELDPLSAMYVPNNIFDYYLNPAKAAGEVYDNRFAVSSWEPWLTFDGISVASSIKQPVYIVHSESGAVPQGAKQFYALLGGEKEITWLNEFNQQQLYFEKPAVNAAIGNVVDYLNK
ncbi:MAG: nuclear transport factor 2 family protein [Bacteroidota bacterium]